MSCTHKVCSKCGEEKPISDFAKRADRRCGGAPACKVCMRQYYRARRDEILAKQKARHLADPRVRLLRNAEYRARARGVHFDLHLEDIDTPNTCPVLGIPLRYDLEKQGDNSPSLDRIVPDAGYVRDNVVTISQRANRLKNNGTAEEHRLIAEWLEANDSRRTP